MSTRLVLPGSHGLRALSVKLEPVFARLFGWCGSRSVFETVNPRCKIERHALGATTARNMGTLGGFIGHIDSLSLLSGSATMADGRVLSRYAPQSDRKAA
jgi:hypothetical protein